jgi:hypothetical protein
MNCEDVVLQENVYSEYFATINGHHGCIVSRYVGDISDISDISDSPDILGIAGQILYNLYMLSEILVSHL